MQNVSRKRILNQHAFLTEILRHLSTKYLFGCFHVVEFQQRQWNALVKTVHSQWEEVIILLFVFLVQLIPISEPKKAFQFSSFYAALPLCLFFRIFRITQQVILLFPPSPQFQEYFRKRWGNNDAVKLTSTRTKICSTSTCTFHSCPAEGIRSKHGRFGKIMGCRVLQTANKKDSQIHDVL